MASEVGSHQTPKDVESHVSKDAKDSKDSSTLCSERGSRPKRSQKSSPEHTPVPHTCIPGLLSRKYCLSKSKSLLLQFEPISWAVRCTSHQGHMGGNYVSEWLLWAGSADDSLLSFQKCVCLYSVPYGLPALFCIFKNPSSSV